ncbi:hypothetical protein [Vibrio superstes]|uniref:Uncharacterized protein n=1 Tax=Vibrio superstes NBRC 103154 TaxID=1219062 RepID=A0A511QVJ7_9VIBR|nr:hypothetical protein [Vibrio superstes]GEM81380.1 hypothetical protein VSU01S_36250 [Vibrio superstes NBRC 103154]
MPYIIRQFVILLLVAALAPMQAIASDAKAPVLSGGLTASQLLDLGPATQQGLPDTSSHSQHNPLAIVQTQRYASVPKQAQELGGAPDHNSDPTAFSYQASDYAYSARLQVGQAVFNHVTGAHRLSGWKDSNALYVALNGQFSS